MLHKPPVDGTSGFDLIDPNLFHNTQLRLSEDSCSSPTAASVMSGGSQASYYDEITDVDIGGLTEEDEKLPQNALSLSPVRPARKGHSLMSLLSGKQPSKRPKLATEEKRCEGKPPPQHDPEVVVIPSDDYPPLDTSFTEEAAEAIRKEQDLIALEQKFFKSTTKAMSAKDFLSSKNTKTASWTDIENIPEEPLIVPSPPTIDLTKSLEAKIFGSDKKAVSARDLLSSLKPSASLDRTAKEQNRWTRPESSAAATEKAAKSRSFQDIFRQSKKSKRVTLTVSPATLKRIHRGASTTVTLKLAPEHLKKVTRSLNPLFTQSSGSKDGKSANDVFKSMMTNAAAQSTYKAAVAQSLKEVPLPEIPKEHFHIVPEETFPHKVLGFDHLTPRSRDLSSLETGHSEQDTLETICSSQLPSNVSVYTTDVNHFGDNSELLEYVLEKVPGIMTTPALRTIYENFLQKNTKDEGQPDSLNWPQLFEPKRASDLLIASRDRNNLRNWVNNAFDRLRGQSLKAPRSALIKRRRQIRNNGLYDGLDGFIVSDELADETDEDEDLFVPLLILHGPTGSCKSASVYAAMSEMNGYVHEVNSGQGRGRKDIYNSLRELSTTQLVHRKDETNEFQKGIILLEDCDVLFEQDKSFWTVVSDILDISKRPVVITCTDLSTVPQSIYQFAAEEDAVIDVGTKDYDLVHKYLTLCCFSQGSELEADVVNKIIEDCSTGESIDVRKALMECQFLCNGNRLHDTLNCMKMTKEAKQTASHHTSSLNELSAYLDNLSASDVLSCNSHSSIPHAIQANELIDVYAIDESLLLRQKSLPYELNIGDHLHEHVQTGSASCQDITSSRKITFNQIRGTVIDFVGSRSKKLPKILQDLYSARATRSHSVLSSSSTPLGISQERVPECTGVPEISILNSLSKTPYILDLTSFARYWAGYQNVLDKIEQRNVDGQTASVKKYIGWREFQQDTSGILKTLS